MNPIDGFRHWRTPQEAHDFAQHAAILSGVMSRVAQNIANDLLIDIQRSVILAHRAKQLYRSCKATMLDIARLETLDHTTDQSLYLMDDVADEVARAGLGISQQMQDLMLDYYHQWGARQPKLMAHAATALYLIAALNTTTYVIAADLAPTLEFRRKLTATFQTRTKRLYNALRALVEHIEPQQHYTTSPTFRFLCDVKNYETPEGAEKDLSRLIHQYAITMLETFDAITHRREKEMSKGGESSGEN